MYTLPMRIRSAGSLHLESSKAVAVAVAIISPCGNTKGYRLVT